MVPSPAPFWIINLAPARARARARAPYPRTLLPASEDSWLDRSLQSAGPGHDLDEALHTTAYRTALPPRRCVLLSEGTKCVLLPFLPELASFTGRLEAVPGRVPAGVPVFVLVDNLIQRLRTLPDYYQYIYI